MHSLAEGSIYADQFELREPTEVRSGVRFRRGDLLLAKITPCFENGKQGIVRNIPGDWGMATTEVYALCGRGISTELLAHYLLDSKVRTGLAAKMQGTTGRQRLPKEALASLLVPVPDPSQQLRMVEILATLDRYRKSLQTEAGALETLFHSLLHHLLTTAEAGKVKN